MSLAKNPSTALSQDAEVGVKWNIQRASPAVLAVGFPRKTGRRLSTNRAIAQRIEGLT